MAASNLLRTLTLAWGLCCALACRADVAIPPLTAHVIDQTATLTVDQQAALDQKLRDFEARKGSQIAVLLIPTTAPETIEQYSLRVAEQWKLGRKQVDDGALLVIAKSDRTLRIEVGYGLEGALNDATSKRIISEVIAPHFSRGDFYGGINAGVDQMIRVIEGEPLPAAPGQPSGGAAGFQHYLPLILIVAFMAGGVLRAVLGRLPGAVVSGGIIAVLTWLFVGAAFVAVFAGIIAFLFTLLGTATVGRGMGGFPGSLGGRGGFGGGGFGGGGGGFGGGGASGRW